MHMLVHECTNQRCLYITFPVHKIFLFKNIQIRMHNVIWYLIVVFRRLGKFLEYQHGKVKHIAKVKQSLICESTRHRSVICYISTRNRDVWYESSEKSAAYQNLCSIHKANCLAHIYSSLCESVIICINWRRTSFFFYIHRCGSYIYRLHTIKTPKRHTF